jgi:hypothetical protein
LRRRRPFIVWLCLLALVWCQVAMASQACHGGFTAAADPMASDCHDMDDGTTDGDTPSCPGSDVVPDLGKLPTVAPLLTGHDFTLAASLCVVALGPVDSTLRPCDGPDLDDLCRLLI